jgi:hypothetical protein
MTQESQEDGAMITFDRTEPAIDECLGGRESDPKLSPCVVPDLSQVTGYTLDDVRYNVAGLQSPAQQRQGYNGIVAQFAGLALCGAFAVYWLVHGVAVVPILMLVFVGWAAFKTMADLDATSAGVVSSVDGDIWTEVVRDSEGPDVHFVHIGGMKLVITGEAYKALEDGGPYRIYYVGERAVGGQVLPGWRRVPVKERKKSWWHALSIEL